MIKLWEVDFEILYDASHHEKVIVKAHTQKKAIQFAKEKIIKRVNTDCVHLVYCRELSKEK